MSRPEPPPQPDATPAAGPVPSADFPGTGAVAALMRATDWAATPVGPVAGWPMSLRTAVRIVLASRHPMFVWWGPRLVNFYNDACAPILGERHPSALGRPAREVWADVWADVGPPAEAVVVRGESTWNERVRLVMGRNGYAEETYFTFSYSPAPDDAGGVGGLFCACTEETQRVLGERRLALLRSLAVATADAETVADVCRRAADVFRPRAGDLPFALVYLTDADGQRARLAAATGIEPGGALAPDPVAVNAAEDGPGVGGTRWPFRRAAAEGRPQVVSGIDGWPRGGGGGGGAAAAAGFERRGPSPHTAVVLPLTAGPRGRSAGFLIAGTSPVRPVDEGYLGFLELVARNLADALAAARSREGRQQQLLAASEAERARLVEVFRRSPAFTAVLRGPDHVFEMANDRYYQTVGHRPIVGRPIREALPEIEGQGFFELLDRVYATGEPFVGRDMRAQLQREPGQPLEERVVEFVFQPIRGSDGAVSGVLVHGIDLTEHNLAEAALRQSEERYRALFERAAVGMAEVDLQGRFVRVNPAYCGITGFAAGELVGRPTSFITHPDDVAGDDAARSSAVDHGQDTIRREKRYRRRDGTTVWVTLASNLIRDEVGRPSHLISAVEDVTARKRAEAALRESEERFRAAFEQADVAMALTDLGGRVTRANPAFCRLTGYDESELIGRTSAHMTHPGDQSANVDVVRQLSDGSTPSVVFEKRYLHKADGRVVWSQASVSLVRDADGEPAELLALVQDVSERKRAESALRESEERLQVAVAIAQLGTFEVDLRSDAILVNASGRAIYGFPPGEPLRFARVRGHFHPADRDEVVRIIGGALAPGGPGRFEFEQRIVRTDGETRWIRVRGRAVPDGGPVAERRLAAGRASGRCVGTFLDITAQREASQRRERLLAAERAARGEAERAGRIKDEFLATLSHELRTPLNAILGWSQIVRGDPSDAAGLAEGLAVIERNARAQAQIVDDLLDMSRIISGKIRLDVRPLGLVDVVRSAVDTARPTADAKGVRLQVDLEAASAGSVSGDPNRLQQVFWNLLTNAVKFTPRGGVVRVAAERDSQTVAVRVVDTGEGIRPDFLPYVFDRFRQADASTTRRHGGLGLGLAIVKQLVELHNGTVRADSAGPGQGATLTVTLPLMSVGVATDAAPPAGPAAGPGRSALAVDRGLAEAVMPRAGNGVSTVSAVGGGGPIGIGPLLSRAIPPSEGGSPDAEVRNRLAGLKVLVVDDEPDARALVRRVLGECRAVVTTAASAAEAVERILADRPDVLVSDIGMPVEDGYALIRRVRGLGPERGGGIPALALTAYATAQDRMRAVLAGFQLHVPKPVEPTELITMVASLASRPGGGI